MILNKLPIFIYRVFSKCSGKKHFNINTVCTVSADKIGKSERRWDAFLKQKLSQGSQGKKFESKFLTTLIKIVKKVHDFVGEIYNKICILFTNERLRILHIVNKHGRYVELCKSLVLNTKLLFFKEFFISLFTKTWQIF